MKSRKSLTSGKGGGFTTVMPDIGRNFLKIDAVEEAGL